MTDEARQQRLARLRAGDEQARQVYADELEQAGRVTEAAWVRLEQLVRRTTGAEQLAWLTKLRSLPVSLDFMASVSRAELEYCGVTFGFRCPRTWDALRPTAEAKVRWCDACGAQVHFAATREDAELHAQRDRCVALADTALNDGAEPTRGPVLGRAPSFRGWKR